MDCFLRIQISLVAGLKKSVKKLNLKKQSYIDHGYVLSIMIRIPFFARSEWLHAFFFPGEKDLNPGQFRNNAGWSFKVLPNKGIILGYEDSGRKNLFRLSGRYSNSIILIAFVVCRAWPGC